MYLERYQIYNKTCRCTAFKLLHTIYLLLLLSCEWQTPPTTINTIMCDNSSVSALSSDSQSAGASQSASAAAWGALVKKSGTTAKEWAHFKTYQNNQKTVRCLLCDKDLQYDKSTSSLTRHLFAMHPARHQGRAIATRASALSTWLLPIWIPVAKN